MAVVSCDEIWDGRKADEESDGLKGYTRAFRVITDDPLDGVLTVLEANDLPTIGEIYFTDVEDDILCVCVKRSPTQDADDPRVWVVVIEYSNDERNPLVQPLDISWGTFEEKRAFWLDVNQDPSVNKAGEEFDPPLEREEAGLTLTIVKNVGINAFDPVTAVAFLWHVNDDTFYGFAAGRVLLARLSARKQTEAGVSYWQLTYEFRIRLEEHKWKIRVLNAGYRELVGTELRPIMIRGQPISKPHPLDSNGVKLADPSPANVIYCEFTAYPEADFDQIGVD